MTIETGEECDVLAVKVRLEIAKGDLDMEYVERLCRVISRIVQDGLEDRTVGPCPIPRCTDKVHVGAQSTVTHVADKHGGPTLESLYAEPR